MARFALHRQLLIHHSQRLAPFLSRELGNRAPRRLEHGASASGLSAKRSDALIRRLGFAVASRGALRLVRGARFPRGYQDVCVVAASDAALALALPKRWIGTKKKLRRRNERLPVLSATQTQVDV